jgi:uncharacterized protein YbjT (DUF2867 family)
MNKVLITGARGNIGKELAKVFKVKDVPFIAGVTDLSKSQDLVSMGYKVKEINYSKPETLIEAMKDVDYLYLMSPLTEHMLEYTKNALTAAKEAGVKFILRLSVIGANPHANFELSRIQGFADESVIHSGITHCIIRPNTFMQNYINVYGGMIKSMDSIYLPQGEGKISFIDTRDIAAAAAEILMNSQDHKNEIYGLTGPEALTNHDVADILSRATDKNIQYFPIEDEAARQQMMKMRMTPWMADAIIGYSTHARHGGLAYISPDIQKILGKQPISFGKFAEEYKKVWM